MRIKVLAGSIAVGLLAIGVSACGANSTNSSTGASHKGPWVIAQSNSYYGNGARIQMKKEIEAEAATPTYKKEVKKLIINNAGNNVSAQVSAIQNMIAEHVNAILIDAASPTGLNNVIAKAHQQGIAVVSYDNLVTSPYAIKVNEPMNVYGADGIKWLVNELHGKGNIVVLRGVAGTTDDALEWAAVQKEVKSHPGIHILNVSYANWDEATAQSIMQNLLNTYHSINGVYTEGGEAYGVIQAYVHAHRKFVPVVGSDTNGTALMAKKFASQGLKVYQVSSDLWRSAKAFQVAMQKLEGKHVPNSIQLPVITWATQTAAKNALPSESASFFLNVDAPKDGVVLTPKQVVSQP